MDSPSGNNFPPCRSKVVSLHTSLGSASVQEALRDDTFPLNTTPPAGKSVNCLLLATSTQAGTLNRGETSSRSSTLSSLNVWEPPLKEKLVNLACCSAVSTARGM